MPPFPYLEYLLPLSRNPGHPSRTSSPPPQAEQYLASLISWRHPEAPLDRATLTALTTAAAAASAPSAAGPGKQQPAQQSQAGGGGGGGGGSTWSAVGAGGGSAYGSVTGGCAGVLAGRLAAWRHALHSLYGTYRGGSCHVFYVINTVRQIVFSLNAVAPDPSTPQHYSGYAVSGGILNTCKQASWPPDRGLFARAEGLTVGLAAFYGTAAPSNPEAFPVPAAVTLPQFTSTRSPRCIPILSDPTPSLVTIEVSA